MPRIQPIDPSSAPDAAKELLHSVRSQLGMTPNLMTTMAHSPAVLKGYLGLSSALASGSLDAQFREEIALTVAQANGCDYCLSAHTAIGGLVKLTEEQLEAARYAEEAAPKRAAGLRFAKAVVDERGAVSDEALRQVRQAGYTDGEVGEIVANVALNVLTNYFNLVADTDIDFPLVRAAVAV